MSATFPLTSQEPAEDPQVAALLASARRVATAFDGVDGPGRLVWHEWGEGRPTVLLHGGAGSWRHWTRNIAPLVSQHRRVLAPDLPGLGESDPPPRPYSPADPAAIVAAGLHSLLGGEPCDLVGFSFGAMVSAHLAAAHPALVRSLILVGAGGLGLPRASITLVPVRNLTGSERAASHRINLARLMLADPAHIDAQALAIQDWNASRARVNSVGFAGSTMLLDALRRVQCPLGAIWGDRDNVAINNVAARADVIRSIRPGASIELIPGAGHWVQFEASAAFDAALTRMLTALSHPPS